MKLQTRQLPSREELRDAFDYEDGELLWKRWGPGVRGRRNQVAGDNGSKTCQYRKVNFAGFRPLLHRLIWVWHNGDIPAGMWVDHINRDKRDNTIENLRLVSWAVNQRNTEAKNKTGLPKHVHRTRSGKFCVILRVGTYETVEEAEKAALRAVSIQH